MQDDYYYYYYYDNIVKKIWRIDRNLTFVKELHFLHCNHQTQVLILVAQYDVDWNRHRNCVIKLAKYEV